MIRQILDLFAVQPVWAQMLIGLVILAFGAIMANFLLKGVVLRILAPILDRRSKTADKAASRLATIVPLLMVSRGIFYVPHLPAGLETLIANVAQACVVLAIALAISQAFNYVDELYQRRPNAKNRPIKGYIQVFKIVVFCAAAIMVVSVLIEQSPLLLLSGLGAMAAVLMLVFKDTILSLVASVQLTSNDMLRVGDWIEMPSMNTDGDVIDIALHTVKVQNFDKTITAIPTHKLISESYKNWRGMSESGGRRIKRALSLDQNSVRFLSEDEIAGLRNFRLLDDYLAAKNEELEGWNTRELGAEAGSINARRITNIGTFRSYVIAYLKAHQGLTQDMTLLVRQLEPSAQGLPLEIYCFTGTTDWHEYEAIQADIFDHLLAILPEFGLRLYQQPSGLDFSGLALKA